MGKIQRKSNLIQPALQLKICLTFMVTSAAGLTLMLMLLVFSLRGVVIGGQEVSEVVTPLLTRAFWLSLLATVPVTFAVGILSTFLVAGPLHRFETFLKAIIRGQRPEDCSLRAGDELKSFCSLLNEATAPLRKEQTVQGKKAA